MACGLPAVVSDAVGCGPDLIDPGKTGELYPMGDVNALSLALERALRLSKDESSNRLLRAKMEVYSLETALDGVIEALERLRRHARKTQHLHQGDSSET
jgi:glycosyltransferase involved in cell wall biosynthesis